MMPRNGRSGKRTLWSPPNTRGIVPYEPSTPANTLTVSPPVGYSSGSAPLPCRFDTTPYGTRGRVSSTVIFSRSPGRAPVTAIGPVTTCGPSTAGSRR